MGKFMVGQKVYISSPYSKHYGKPVIVLGYAEQNHLLGSGSVRILLMDGDELACNERLLSTHKPGTRSFATEAHVNYWRKDT